VGGDRLFDLRCQLREGLVVWLRREAAHALPRVRHEGVPEGVFAEDRGRPAVFAGR
jgi:hypothetical protein